MIIVQKDLRLNILEAVNHSLKSRIHTTLLTIIPIPILILLMMIVKKIREHLSLRVKIASIILKPVLKIEK